MLPGMVMGMTSPASGRLSLMLWTPVAMALVSMRNSPRIESISSSFIHRTHWGFMVMTASTPSFDRKSMLVRSRASPLMESWCTTALRPYW